MIYERLISKDTQDTIDSYTQLIEETREHILSYMDTNDPNSIRRCQRELIDNPIIKSCISAIGHIYNCQTAFKITVSKEEYNKLNIGNSNEVVNTSKSN